MRRRSEIGSFAKCKIISIDEWSEFRPNLDIFGVRRNDAGWLYLMKSGDLFKIGKTKNPKRRIRDAQTWIPDIEIIAMKPF